MSEHEFRDPESGLHAEDQKHWEAFLVDVDAALTEHFGTDVNRPLLLLAAQVGDIGTGLAIAEGAPLCVTATNMTQVGFHAAVQDLNKMLTDLYTGGAEPSSITEAVPPETVPPKVMAQALEYAESILGRRPEPGEMSFVRMADTSDLNDEDIARLAEG